MAITNDQRLAALEGQVAALGRGKKDGWDVVSIVAAVAVPVSIAILTYFTHGATIRATAVREEAEQNRLRAQQHADSKLQQGELVLKFFEPLMGNDPKRSELAVQSLLVAAPDYGPMLVRVVASNPSPNADYAKQALVERRDSLMREMFSDDAAKRIDAYGQLLSSWRSDEAMVAALVEYAMTNRSNPNGTYNALLLLNQVDRHTAIAKKHEIIELTNAVESDGSKIHKLAAALRASLHS
ncbi:hypothetical protein [Stenotrophomonas maltophilia]|uniref:hypothetical protein n=1 Tax=Stenotrophomonas maltophilia TaxID=40324 RepID=UPI002893BFBD|nr:hypothetical protein [Stenotrophomonas maltophilia]MDT3487535.1 hypothetical protein [Stenotrophomonas maltophilia]